MSNNKMISSVMAGVVLGAAAVAGCGDGRRLAELTNKQLDVTSPWTPQGYVMVSLNSDTTAGCPVLDPDGLEATLNGLPMAVDPGHIPGDGEPGWCYEPAFRLEPLPADIGSTLTIVISDSSQTLRMVVSDVHAHSPSLEPTNNQARVVHPGQRLAFAITSPDGVPDLADSYLFQDVRNSDGTISSNEWRPPATVADGHVSLQLPALGYAPATLTVCATFSQQMYVSDCENASCELDYPWSSGCERYPLDVQP